MCLDKVKETYDSPSTLIVDGWKDFGGTDARPEVQWAIKGSNKIPLDTWIAASDEHAKAIRASDGKNYRPGFHAYTDEREKMRNFPKARRVFLRRITCMGTQNNAGTVIAQEMYVPSKPNGWPPLSSVAGEA